MPYIEYTKKRRKIISVFAATCVTAMGFDGMHTAGGGDIKWGNPLFWGIVYAVPAILLLAFAFRQTLSLLRNAAIVMMAVGFVRGLVLFLTEDSVFALANNLLMMTLFFSVYIQTKDLLNVTVYQAGDQ
jgi:hypothetical protein